MTGRETPPLQSAVREESTATELDHAGLLYADHGAQISRFAIFVPADAQGTQRPIVIEAGVTVGAFAVVHGGTTIRQGARIEHHAVVGQPELGYAVGHTYDGIGGTTTICAGAVIRAGAIVYAKVHIGIDTVVGHGTTLRTEVRIGRDTQLGHLLTVERSSWIGRSVRCSPGSHITSSCHLADGVFLGAGVRTINDRTMVWRHPSHRPALTAPRFGAGARIGSGSVVLAGVTVGERALVGAGSLVTRDIPPNVLAYGQPARIHGVAP